MLTLGDLALAVGADPPARARGLAAGPASIDTRQLQPGEVFYALTGERTDGHAFVGQAAARGACGAVVRRGARVEAPAEFPLIEVSDPLRALWAHGRLARSRFSGTLVAVTGSNGKTTCKEMLAAIFGQALGTESVLRNQGSFNNHLGVPLTLTRLSQGHRVAVLEMGMNHPGEIAELAGLARPLGGVITSIGRAHLEGLGSLEAVARAKGELLEALPEDGFAVVPVGWPLLAELAGRLPEDRVWTVGPGGRVRVVDATHEPARGLRVGLETPVGRIEAVLAVAGAHNAANAAAAAAAALLCGLELEAIQAGLVAFRPAPHRSALVEVGGALVLDDCYNANPTSMEAALRTLGELPGRKGAIFGDMAELGDEAPGLHEEVLGRAAEVLELLLVAGPLMERASRGLAGRLEILVARDAEEAGRMAARVFGPGWSVLVKGSRIAQLERAIETWRRDAEAKS